MATVAVQQILESFARLPDMDKREVAAAIMRWAIGSDVFSLTDEELALNAEELFLELDARESRHGQV